MSEQQKSLIDIIRQNVEKAKKTINDKVKAESMIMDSLNEINRLLGNKVKFESYNEIDSDGDNIVYISVENNKSGYSESLIAYYFHAEKIFPAFMGYQNIIRESCNNLADVENFIKRLVSNESFMIKIIRVSEQDEAPKASDDIPF